QHALPGEHRERRRPEPQQRDAEQNDGHGREPPVHRIAAAQALDRDPGEHGRDQREIEPVLDGCHDVAACPPEGPTLSDRRARYQPPYVTASNHAPCPALSDAAARLHWRPHQLVETAMPEPARLVLPPSGVLIGAGWTAPA